MFLNYSQLFLIAHKICSSKFKIILSHSRTRREAKSLTRIKGFRTFLSFYWMRERIPTLLTGLLPSGETVRKKNC